MTVFIPYPQWFTVQQWMAHNYITSSDYTWVWIEDRVAITFASNMIYARFYRVWQHIILADNDF
jgi:hypothetical protein